MMKYSVVIPAYNVEEKIKKGISSILRQSEQNIEIIIVNDGSTDSTHKIVDELSKEDSRIIPIHQVNQGPMIARINGVKRATGKYILFMDSDDYFEKELFETLNHYEQYDYDMFIFRMNFRDEHGNCYKVSEELFENESIFTDGKKKIIYKKVIETYKLNSLCIKAVKRDLFDNNIDYSKYLGIKNGEDLIQSLPIITKAKEIFYIGTPLYNYVHNHMSTTQNFSLTFYQSRKLLLALLEEYINVWGLDIKEYFPTIHQRFLNEVIGSMPQYRYYKTMTLRKVFNFIQDISFDETFRNSFNMYGKNVRNRINRFQLKILYQQKIRLYMLISLFRNIATSLLK